MSYDNWKLATPPEYDELQTHEEEPEDDGLCHCTDPVHCGCCDEPICIRCKGSLPS